MFVVINIVGGYGCGRGGEFFFVGYVIGGGDVHRDDEGCRVWSGLGLVFRVFFTVWRRRSRPVRRVMVALVV